MAAEIWKPVRGYEKLYEVSDLGRVRNSKTKNIKVPQLTNSNYSQVLLWIKHKAKAFYIHRLVGEVFIPNPNNYTDINHKNGNKQNNCVDNLEWCTRSENMKHAYKNGLRKASTQILTIEDVKYIKENPKKLTRKQLADKFKVSYWCICDIYQGKCFKERG